MCAHLLSALEGRLTYFPCRVSSTIYTADARYVITGSDDGNVRIWKAKASEKLGIVTARERAALEYRESLKERWKMDAEVGKVMRYVACLNFFHQNSLKRFAGVGMCRSPCTRLRNCGRRCWKPGESRKNADVNILGLEKRNRNLSGKELSLRSRLEQPATRVNKDKATAIYNLVRITALTLSVEPCLTLSTTSTTNCSSSREQAKRNRKNDRRPRPSLPPPRGASRSEWRLLCFCDGRIPDATSVSLETDSDDPPESEEDQSNPYPYEDKYIDAADKKK